MNASTLEKLICPETQQHLQCLITDRDGEHVTTGSLHAGGERAYPIANGIPCFVAQGANEAQTAVSFDAKWRMLPDYRQQTGTFYTDWFLERYGFKSRDDLATMLRDAAFVLDAGTGSGRDAANFAELCHEATIFAVDLTAGALDNARQTVTLPNVAFVQADINRLPFPDGFFDFVCCDQVIHHTPDPPAAFEQLGAKVRSGGQICVYVYRKKAVIREFVDDLVREEVKAMPFEQAAKVCEAFTQLGKTLADVGASLTIESDIPSLGIRRGTYDLQRFVHYNLFKCFWNDDFDFLTNNIINTDWYHPEHCFRYEPEAFRAWFDADWDILHFDVQEAGISCRARRR